MQTLLDGWLQLCISGATLKLQSPHPGLNQEAYSMRKGTGIFMVLALLLLSSPAIAQPGTCVPGGIFYGPDGRMADCLESTGDNCLACTFIMK
jgi:hypothetical protein